MSGRRALVIFIVLFFAGGCCMLGNGLYIKGKAAMAQILLVRAWEKTVQGGLRVKPWPWADTWPVARLEFPGHGVEFIVLEGEYGSTLAFGPGRVAGSARPGMPGNCVICGHRDTSFHFLEQVHFGDRCILETPDGRKCRFAVTDIVIEEAAKLQLPLDADEPRLSLITCYPFDGLAPTDLRYLVFAEALKS